MRCSRSFSFRSFICFCFLKKRFIKSSRLSGFVSPFMRSARFSECALSSEIILAISAVLCISVLSVTPSMLSAKEHTALNAGSFLSSHKAFNCGYFSSLITPSVTGCSKIPPSLFFSGSFIYKSANNDLSVSPRPKRLSARSIISVSSGDFGIRLLYSISVPVFPYITVLISTSAVQRLLNQSSALPLSLNGSLISFPFRLSDGTPSDSTLFTFALQDQSSARKIRKFILNRLKIVRHRRGILFACIPLFLTEIHAVRNYLHRFTVIAVFIGVFAHLRSALNG